MISETRRAFILFLLLSILTGAAYPLFVTIVAQTAFSERANGSLVMRNGVVVGSKLIGQQFTGDRYIWGRPSSTAPRPYNAAASGGSNLGPTNPDRLQSAADRIAALRKSHPDQPGRVPLDLITASASGLDPHISPEAADFQVSRVAKARGLDEATVRRANAAHTLGRTLLVLGEPRVNVLELNLALDEAERR